MIAIYGDGTLKVPFQIDSEKYESNDLLDIVFNGMNKGSGKEFEWFKNIPTRSMSVGDFVQIQPALFSDNPIIYQVASFGFNRVSKEFMEVFLKEVKTLTDLDIPDWEALVEVNRNREKIGA